MKKKTIFNLIGPLSSPAQVKRQVIGVFNKKWMKPFAEALKENGVVHAYIVHSDDGMDEISPFAKTNVVELKNGNINNFIIDPKNLGINSIAHSIKDIQSIKKTLSKGEVKLLIFKASSTSADPQFDETALLPCLATLTPILDKTIAAAVEILSEF